MARTNLLNTRTTNFLELVGNGRIYRVPPYQRDYSWEEEQWEDLWNDIVELRGKGDDRHYMGALVVESQSDREFLIIDGQQRIATLSIFVLAALSHLVRLAAAGVDAAANRERASALRGRFIGEKDPASLIESSKLFLNSNDDGFYQDYLVQLRTPRNPRGLTRSNRLLWECFTYFQQRLTQAADLATDGAALASLVAETAGRQLQFILITVDNDLNAYTVFETLNARGLELSSTDLLKNYLFSGLHVRTELQALERRWRALLATVQQERFPEFLRYHLLTLESRVRSQRLFQAVRSRVRTADEVFALMDALEHRAELFAALSDPNHEYWIEIPEARPHVRELQLFRVRQMMPMLFAAWERLDKAAFTSVLRTVAIISFRYAIVGGLNPNALEPVYHDASRAILDGTATTAAQVFDRLRPLYVADDKFLEDFSRFVTSTGGQRKKVVKYILARLEEDASGHAVNPEPDPGTIEHILPENPSGAWETTFPDER